MQSSAVLDSTVAPNQVFSSVASERGPVSTSVKSTILSYGGVAASALMALLAAVSQPPLLVGKKFPPLFVVETEFALALIKAELAFVNELVRRITIEGWGPVELWRELQAACARQHEALCAAGGTAGEAAM